ncbi:site-2 protease family protein [Vitreoscilla stercoraria]|uniref:Site-2 protease family protein n=1 Tax=Vitreoscilla stercoraria TaxID=61 RepID=A0ABY4EBV9_VITST|nr:site-2 protease family protein [Vitreoscilla stercoraria]UOO92400.1 site-2 protease family protein [Vitreoscilla stercoraria]
MFQSFDLGIFLLAIVPVLLALTVHEASHGYMARHYGDRTAEQLGRLTLNPLAHIDLVGTIIIPLLTFMFTPFIFGWAKPVPVQTRNLRNMRVGMRMVAIAGPASNLMMALVWAVILGLSYVVPMTFQEGLAKMASIGIMINAVLFTLNMLPILPLDGGRFVDSFLPAKASQSFQKIEPYGTWILIGLMMTGLLWMIMGPVVTMIMKFSQLIAALVAGIF